MLVCDIVEGELGAITLQESELENWAQTRALIYVFPTPLTRKG